MTELKTSSLEDEVSNGLTEGRFTLHEEEKPGITLVGKQEGCVRKRGNQLHQSSGRRYAQVLEVRSTVRERNN